MTTEWAHLPNAVHIDRLMDSIRTKKQIWANIYLKFHYGYSIGNDLRTWQTTIDKVNRVERPTLTTILLAAENICDVRLGFSNPSRDAYQVVADSLLALFVYPECAYMLDSEPSELAVIATVGDDRAKLMLGACIIFSAEKDK